VASARSGARTALIEGTGNFGGMSTSGMVPIFNPFTNGKNLVIKGIGLEVLKELRKRGSALQKPDPLPREVPEWDWVTLDAEKLKVVYDDLLTRAKVNGRLFTEATEPDVKNGIITGIHTWSKSGEEIWKGKVFVDATGDADLAARAGCPFEKGNEFGKMQPTTVCFVVTGFSPKTGRLLRTSKWVRPFLKKASLDGKLSGKYDNHYCIDAITSDYTVLGFNYKHQVDTDGTDAASLTRAIMQGRAQAYELCDFLRKNVDGCKNIFLASSARLVGVRETRRIVGEYRIDKDHFFSHKKSVDDIASHSNELDVHMAGNDPKAIAQANQAQHDSFLDIGTHYGIPYRALIPKGAKNLLVAGRAVSSERAVQGALRTMPCCFATGQAAGVAAKLALKSSGHIREVSVKVLQKALLKQGAYIDLKQGK
jgi:hypothetical protein